MTSRFRLILVACTFALAGCNDSFNAGPMKYVDSPQMEEFLKDKPNLQEKVRGALATLFGENPQRITVPKGSGFYDGGKRLANLIDDHGEIRQIAYRFSRDPEVTRRPQEGGYGLYRQHCLHCHGVSGAGDGPTAPFLYPKPRDYRNGLFKFTSTNTGAKPTRADLRKTILDGIHGTSMPAFVAMLDEAEVEQVLDYVIFLSMRGETERLLIDAANTGDESDPLPEEIVNEVAQAIFNKWRLADSQVLNPPIPKPPSDRASVLRGKAIFLKLNTTGEQVDCTSCHGPQAIGNGPIFVDQEIFEEVVFSGNPSGMQERLSKLKETDLKAWKESLDDWGNPIRPANLNISRYKGGRRPLDLYWRIAKGINGAKMPAHTPLLKPNEVWDVVNFVLALPYEPDLLKGAKLPTTPPNPALTPPKVADR